MESDKSMIIGIDLGTTNSLVSVWKDGESILIPNALGELMTPSAISLGEKKEVFVGQAAKERLSTHPENTAVDFKRYMGTDREIKLGKKNFRAEELSSFIIRQLKADAETYLGEPVDEAIITVPAYFSDAQRKATRIAGELAGIKVERLLNEPTAAAMAHGLHSKDDDSKYLIFDLGGGTFDVSILELFDGVMEVHASAGDNHLGGTDFTEAIAKHFSKTMQNELTGDTASFPLELEKRILISAEKAKREIGDRGKSTMSVVWQDQAVNLEISELEFENLVTPLLDRLSNPIRRALRDAKIRVNEIDDIVFVGGATKMPSIKKLATRLFQRFPATGINPDHVVAQGAAVQAGLKSRDAALSDVVLTDVSPYTLGTEVIGGDTNHPVAGHFYPIIERNSYIPVSRVERLYTAADQQKELAIKIYQGENPLVKDNVFLGQLLIPVPPGPAGQEAVDVRYTYDINGLLEAVVKVVSTGKEKSIIIEENPGVLSSKEIKERFKKLDAIKIHPRDQQENAAIIARLERLYRETLGDERTRVGEILSDFMQLLNRQDQREIQTLRKQFEQIIDELEGAYRF
jgi:molecular chaperone HscC